MLRAACSHVICSPGFWRCGRLAEVSCAGSCCLGSLHSYSARTFRRHSTPGHLMPLASSIPGGWEFIWLKDSNFASPSISYSIGSERAIATSAQPILATTVRGDGTTLLELENI